MKKFLIFIGIFLFVSSASIIPALNIKQTSESNFKTKTMFAETWFVDNEGDGDYSSIQAAINDANPGDIIKVYSGKYNEKIYVNVESIVIEGVDRELNNGTDKGMPEIIGDGEGSVVGIAADNIEFKGFTIYGSGGCIFDAGINITSDYNTIINNILTRNHHGIFMINCNYNNILSNTIIQNFWDGIHILDFCHDNIIRGNNINSNNVDGVKLYLTDNTDNTIIYNEITSNRWNGVHIMYSVGNEILKNNISSNFWDGIHLGNAKDNVFRLNQIISNFKYGVLLFDGCSDNQIYHNNIVNNICFDEGDNIWDNGYPNGGNFWADYTGNDTNGDGFGDIPYDVPGGENQDSYPFMDPILAPLKPTRPIGKIRGRAGEEYSYTTIAIDPNGDEVQYGWDWNGDKVVDEWTDFYELAVPCTAYHTWSKQGAYIIYVKAMDPYGIDSEWSEPLPVNMPMNRFTSGLFFKLFEKFPSFQKLIERILIMR
jgi:parallel beta-helix repeat protein